MEQGFEDFNCIYFWKTYYFVRNFWK